MDSTQKNPPKKVVRIGKKEYYKSLKGALEIPENQKDTQFIFEEGIYEENFNLKNIERIQLIGEKKQRVEITHQNGMMGFNNSSDIAIEGLIFSNQLHMRFTNCNKIVISNCLIQSLNVGIGIMGNCSDVMVDNNVFFKVLNGLYIRDPQHSSTITNNLFILNPTFAFLSFRTNSQIKQEDIFTKNIIVNSNIGSQAHTNNSIKGKNIITTDAQIFAQGGEFLKPDIKLYDIESYDFRLKSPEGYSDFGPSTSFLNQIRKWFNPNLKGLDDLPIKEIGVFYDFSLDVLRNEFETVIKQNIEKQELNYHSIDIFKNLQKSSPQILFFIHALDKHPQPIIKQLTEQFQQTKQPFYFCIPELGKYRPLADRIIINSEEAKQREQELKKQYPEKIIEYQTIEQLSDAIIKKVANHIPKVIIQQLDLKNIGHFDELTLSFDPQLTCIIGLNGTGKTTIMRSIAAALIGKPTDEDKNLIADLLKIHGLTPKNYPDRKNGSLKITYSIEGKQEISEIKLVVASDNEATVETNNNFPLLKQNFLRLLVVGFAQVQRKSSLKRDTDKMPQNPEGLAHINDLIGLIENEEGDSRMPRFESWLVELHGKATEYEKENKNAIPKERKIIELLFKILSEITTDSGEFAIELYKVVKYNPPDIWIKTPDAPNGISLKMLSQGYQALMRTVGCFIERMQEAYSDSSDFTQEYAVAIIDEVDTYLHPQWQQRILNVLVKYFPHTQFIINTHSPLVISGLDKRQIIELAEENGKIVDRFNETAVWAWSIQDILLKLFDVMTTTKYNLQVLKNQLDRLPPDSEVTTREALEKKIEVLEDSAKALEIMNNQDLEALKKNYEERKAYFDSLIEDLEALKNNELITQ